MDNCNTSAFWRSIRNERNYIALRNEFDFLFANTSANP